MKLTKKIIAVFLTILTLFMTCSIVMPVFAEYEWETDYDISDEEIITEVHEEPEIISEITEKRQENTKYFLMSDGSFMAAQYSSPVHYLDDNGEWLDYNNSLSETKATEEQSELFGESEIYITGNKSENIVFAPKSNSNTLVSYEANEYPISFNYQSAKKSYIKVNDEELELKGNDAYLTLPDVSQEVLYEDVFNDVDLQYIVNPGEIKENIILKNKDAENSFTVNYNIGALTAEVIDSNTINLVSGENIVYTISAPYMYDSAGAISDEVTFTVDKNKNGKLRVNITVNDNWLQSNDRVYPVIIDPTTTTETTQDAIDSVFVANNSSYANTNFVDRMEMLVGRETSAYGYCHSLFKFELPELNKGDMVVKALFNVPYYNYNAYADTTPDLQVNAHLLQGDWDKSTVTWNNCPNYSSTILDYQIFTREPDWKDFDISSAVKQWYEDESSNYGILLKGVNETGTMAETGFKASIWTERYNIQTGCYPRIEITYRNNKGIEDYWTYTTLSAGTAGTAYINDYTGNLVFIHGDVATTGELMPISLEHVYNGYMANSHSGKYPRAGDGFKLSLQQTVIDSDPSNSVNYVYEDGDGTEHYFYKETKDGVTRYIDEDGLNLELEVLSSGYKITDKVGNVMTFGPKGNLTSIADAEGRVATLSYDKVAVSNTESISLLKKITDGAGHTIKIAYNSASSEVNKYQITSIEGPDGKCITYTYNSYDRLKTITYPNGKSSTYTYDNDGTLTKAKSSDGYMLTFEYSSDGSKRVARVFESNGNTEGQTIKFDRSKVNQTKVRTSGKDAIIGNDDDLITTYQFDDLGRTISTKIRLSNGVGLGAEKYEYTLGTQKGGTDIGKRNRVSSSAAMGKNIDNVLSNHSFENSSGWTGLYWINNSYTTVSSASYNTNENYIGKKSIAITINEGGATTNGGYGMYQDVTNYVSPGTYTLSGYVKTNNVVMGTGTTRGGACLAVRVVDTNGGYARYYSDMLTETTDNSIDNGWSRIHVSFTIYDGDSVRVEPLLYNATGTAYFDCLQLEKSDVPNNYNLLENSSFEKDNASWLSNSLNSNDGVATERNNGGSKSFKITGEADKPNKYVRQTVYLNCSEKDTFILSGNVWANSIPIDMSAGRRMDIGIKINYTDGTSITKQPTIFNYAVPSSWQFSSGTFTLSDNDSSTDKIAESVMIYCGYRRQANSCYFDDISLLKEPVPTYTYDDDGNLISATENAAKTTNLNYDGNNNLSSFTDEKENAYEYKYAETGNKHRLLTATSKTTNITYAYSYNASGIAFRQDLKDSNDNVIRTGNTYTEASDNINQHAYVKESKNQHGYTTTYNYDLQSGLLNSVTDINDNVTEYTYDANTNLLKTVEMGNHSVSYNYNDFGTRLNSITHNGFNYNFEYDAFGNVTKTLVGSQPLMTNEYKGNNGNLVKSTYGNGDTKAYTYNDYGQITTLSLNNQTYFSWKYNSSGMPYQYTDHNNNRIYNYVYDSLGRIVRQYGNTKSTGANRFISQYTYDISNNITRAVTVADGEKVAANYTYDKANRPTKTTLNSDINYVYAYDSLGRLSSVTMNNSSNTPIKTEYTYYTSARDTIPNDDVNYTTTQIQSETLGDKTAANSRTYEYTYGKRGNITKITEKVGSGAAKEKASYTYDALGQLKTEKNVDTKERIEYTYDKGGNLTKKQIYHYENGEDVYLKETITYGYDENWKDKLISIKSGTDENPQIIEYDAIGNPETYRDGMSFTWQGRQMSSATLSNGTAVTYTYDADGLRTTKQVGSTLYEYEYVGGQLVYEKRGDLRFYYRYDSFGRLASIKRINTTGSTYTVYTVINSRGDIEELRHYDGSLIARYKYDAWGKTKVVDANGDEITSSTSIAVQNPFRYRGYYFDSESGLYYLKSRYYDPITCRFLNADSLVDTSNVLGFNMFAYCGNNPVNYSDPSGHFWEETWNRMKEGAKKVGTWINDKVIQPVKEFFKPKSNNSNVKKRNKTIKGLAKTMLDAASLEVGAGYGFGVSTEAGVIGFEASYKGNPLHVVVTSKDGESGLFYTFETNCSVDALAFEIYSKYNEKTRFFTQETIYCESRNYIGPKREFSVGISLYFLIGFEIEVSYNYGDIIEYIAVMQ